MSVSVPRPPTPGEIREALGRVLASRFFKAAHRSSGFLRYVVEEAIAGRAERLKGYSIAVDVFGKPLDFDASADPIVRVEARRVRQRLAQFYLHAGERGGVKIELPTGGYVPRFSVAHVPRAASRGRRPRRIRVALWMASAALAVTLAWSVASCAAS